MTRTLSTSDLDPRDRQKVSLLHSAFVELFIGPESDDPLVQVAFHALLAWLRGEAADPHALLEAFGAADGPLTQQLGFVGSLLHDPEAGWPSETPRLWWWVVRAAFYRRWQELTDPCWGRRRRARHRQV
jgi:hypothetical protein